MSWLWVVLGLVLIAAGLIDVFFAVLHYEAFGFLSGRLRRLLWNAVRAATRPLPQGLRDFGLTLGAPLMIPITAGLWAVLELLGFALLYYVGMSRQHFVFDEGVSPSFGAAVYLSGVTLATLGYGDITPDGGLYQVLATSEALIGFGLFTLTISFVLSSYQVRQHFGVLATWLYDRAPDPGDPWSILVMHFQDGRVHDLTTHLTYLHHQLVELEEGIRRYPVAYYFYSREVYRSLPYMFFMVGGLIEALRWGLPKDHPLMDDPSLPALVRRLTATMVYLEQHFVTRMEEADPKPVSGDVFAVALEEQRSSDPWVEQFMRLDQSMRYLARLECPPNPEEAYNRYLEWLPFAHHFQRFVAAIATDLGYEPTVLTRDPGVDLF